jgi:hypothetical protein
MLSGKLDFALLSGFGRVAIRALLGRPWRIRQPQISVELVEWQVEWHISTISAGRILTLFADGQRTSRRRRHARSLAVGVSAPTEASSS